MTLAVPSVSVNSSLVETLGNGTGGAEWYDPTNAYYYEAFYLTNATPGVPLTVSVASSSFDTILGVYNLDTGAYVAIDDNSGGGSNSALYFTPNYGDSYAVVVSSVGHNSTGSYTVSVSA